MSIFAVQCPISAFWKAVRWRNVRLMSTAPESTVLAVWVAAASKLGIHGRPTNSWGTKP